MPLILGGGVPFDVCSALPLLSASTCSLYQGRIQEFALGEPCPTTFSLPSPPLPFPLKVESPLNQLAVWQSAVSSPSGKTNLVHSTAVRKPLVGIILSTLKCMYDVTSVGPTPPPLYPPLYSCWVVLQPYPHGWSAVGKFSVDVQGR